MQSPVQRRTLSSSTGFRPGETPVPPTPRSCDNQKWLQSFSSVPWGADSSRSGSTDLKVSSDFSSQGSVLCLRHGALWVAQPLVRSVPRVPICR